MMDGVFLSGYLSHLKRCLTEIEIEEKYLDYKKYTMTISSDSV